MSVFGIRGSGLGAAEARVLSSQDARAGLLETLTPFAVSSEHNMA